MKIVVLGLSITSSWGNGHATTYRALLGGLRRAGHETLFLERDAPWYAENRDAPDAGELYGSVEELRERWTDDVREADLAVVGSYVPEGVAVAEWLLDTARGVTAFYDIDTPVTLAKLARGDEEYLAARLVPRFDLYLSFTGGPTLRRLERDWGARRARVLSCAVDAERYAPVDIEPRYDLGYLGTYSADRQPGVERLLLEPARRVPHAPFALAGPQYPEEIEWPANVERIEHLPPADHPQFYAAQRFTLNVTRADMVRAGWSPSVRLFEAAACGVPAISDWWDGLDGFFRPGAEILVARRTEDVIAALRRDDAVEIGERARRRILAEHTADRRAEELEALVGELAGAWAA
jgi:spore maturation protein CgeB